MKFVFLKNLYIKNLAVKDIGMNSKNSSVPKQRLQSEPQNNKTIPVK
jgi:hypothetical protein